MKRSLLSAGALLAFVLLAGCGVSPSSQEPAEAKVAAGYYERGPHRGRMLRDGEFAVEITIFEDGVDPEFRVYAYRNDKPLAPGEIQLAIELSRLGGKVDRFVFTPQEDFLRGGGVVTEPHSFDVKVRVAAPVFWNSKGLDS